MKGFYHLYVLIQGRLREVVFESLTPVDLSIVLWTRRGSRGYQNQRVRL